MYDKKMFKEIKSNIDNIRIFDTHEHIPSEVERKRTKLDFFNFFSCYCSTDLVSSGFREEDLMILRDP